MEAEFKREALKSQFEKFDKDFADFAISRHKEGMRIKQCTFFHKKDKGEKWASCLFHKIG